ncbi:MAG: protein kinase domain-containing protein, partial [Solimonas sp.]
GQGGFGITYRARDTQLGREVAIKEYLPAALAIRQDGTTVLPRSTEVADDFAWGRERFVAEGRTLASLDEAPAVVRVHDFLEANGTAYIVMELLRGETLERRVTLAGPLSPTEFDRLLWPLLDGLQKVHEAGFLHRDVKPANVLLSARGRPVLIDFGASRAAMASRSTSMTAVFTPGYAAPEQFASARQGPWTDIYGMAATFHYALTGRAPPSAFDRLMSDRYERLARLQPPGFALGTLLGLDAGLCLEASQRPQTIAAWRALFGGQALPDGKTVLIARLPPAPQVVRAPRRTRWIVAGTALAAFLAAGGYYVLAPGPQLPVAAPGNDVKPAQRQAEMATQKAAVEATPPKTGEDARRKLIADAEKKRLENEARQKAEAEAQARRLADDEAKARTERSP